DAEARLGQGRDLPPPRIPKVRKAVQQDHKRPGAGLDVVEPHAVDDGPVVGPGLGSCDRTHAPHLPREIRSTMTRPLFRPCCTSPGTSVPRHSRASVRPKAIAMSMGMPNGPCGWMTAKRKLVSVALSAMLTKVPRWPKASRRWR